MNPTELQHFYADRFGGREAYRMRVWGVLVRNFFQSWIRAGDTVLDLGAGYGEFINQVVCGKKYAMDLNPDTPAKVAKEVTVLAQDSSAEWPLSEESLDVVFTSNFFEHLPDVSSLQRTLAHAYRCLRKEGRLIALGPNLRHTGAAYWEVEDHQLALTEKSLAETLTHTGFRIEICRDKFLPFSMATGIEYPVFCVALYLRVPLAWRIFGKQFLVIARKESA